ncbi:phosphoinositide 3-kinase regulatory subunit 6 isoform X2 [Lissotriton helveticus]
MDCTEVEADLYRKVQAILREADGQNAGLQCDRGMLRWTLHKSIDRNPNSASILVKLLVKELEKAPYISDDLYERVYDFCKKLLTRPKPYCAIGLSYAKGLKRERKVPGLFYQRMVIAEQSLRNESYQHQEKVLVFLDEDLIPETICNALLHETQAAKVHQTPTACMCLVITHTMQAALGQHCDVQALQGALQRQSAAELEQCFQDVVAAAELTLAEVNADRSRHAERLANIYSTLISPSPQGGTLAGGLSNVPLPNPDISFHLWKKDDQFRKQLVTFSKSQSQITEEEGPDLNPNRASVLSNDSGIEKDLPVCEEKVPSGLQRRPCIKKNAQKFDSMAFMHTITKAHPGKQTGTMHRMSGEATETTPNLQKRPTARVVILGDDRSLGRLAKEYYALRKCECKPFGTIKANLQFYYIPVLVPPSASPANKENTTASKAELCELAQYLGRVDPWYESNINPLCDMIPKLANMPSSPSQQLAADPFITDVTAYYLRTGLQPVHFQIYFVKIYFSDLTQPAAEDTFLTELKADLQELAPYASLKSSGSSKKKTMVETPSADVDIQYKKALLSNREKDVTLSLRSSGLVMKAIPSNETEDLVCLHVNITEVTKSTNISGRSFSCDTSTVRTSSIKARSPSHASFTLCMDKDVRRTYDKVERFEVSPCLEPVYALQRKKGERLCGSKKEDIGLAKYMSKSLMLPINTFAAVI